MQTSAHLRFGCSLRAISLGQNPGRWRTPSMRESTSIWEALSALPNPPGPTLAVGSPAVPRPGARVVAPRWRWSRLPGAGAERAPRCLRTSMGPALRGGGSATYRAANHGTARGEGRIRQARSSRIIAILPGRPSFRNGDACSGARGRGGKTKAGGLPPGCRRGLPRGERRPPACTLPPGLSACPGSRLIGAGEARGSRPPMSAWGGCPPGGRPGRETPREGRSALPAAALRGENFPVHATCTRRRCCLTCPLAGRGILALSLRTPRAPPAIYAAAGCPPGRVQVPCWSLDLGGVPAGRARRPGCRSFPMEVAWPATTSR